MGWGCNFRRTTIDLYLHANDLIIDVDVEVARAEEERLMEEDAQSWLNQGRIDEEKDPKTGEHGR